MGMRRSHTIPGLEPGSGPGLSGVSGQEASHRRSGGRCCKSHHHHATQTTSHVGGGGGAGGSHQTFNYNSSSGNLKSQRSAHPTGFVNHGTTMGGGSGTGQMVSNMAAVPPPGRITFMNGRTVSNSFSINRNFSDYDEDYEPTPEPPQQLSGGGPQQGSGREPNHHHANQSDQSSSKPGQQPNQSQPGSNKALEQNSRVALNRIQSETGTIPKHTYL